MTIWKEMSLIELKASSAADLRKWCQEAGIQGGVAKDDLAQRLFAYLSAIESRGMDVDGEVFVKMNPESNEAIIVDPETVTFPEATPAVSDGSDIEVGSPSEDNHDTNGVAAHIKQNDHTEPVTEKPDPQLLTSPLETEDQIGKPCWNKDCPGIMKRHNATQIRCSGPRGHTWNINE